MQHLLVSPTKPLVVVKVSSSSTRDKPTLSTYRKRAALMHPRALMSRLVTPPIRLQTRYSSSSLEKVEDGEGVPQMVALRTACSVG